MSRFFYKPYVPVAQRRLNAAKKMKSLAKQGQKIEPVEIVHRRKIADSFWGRAWCEHLESYSDFANRLPRGRTYVRNGSVCHLAVATGRIDALVMGSSLYRQCIRVDPLPPAKWEALKQRCRGGIGSLIELLQGRISDEIMGIVTDRSAGLFPAPREIHTDCDCPDWADLCKHLAAVLYGVGARLDSAPELLFKLRGVDHRELIDTDVGDIGAATRKGGSRRRVLDADALGGVFGIEMDDGDGEVAEVAPLSSTRKQAARKKPAQKKAVKKKAAKKRAVQKKTAKKQAAQPRPAKKAAARKKAAFRATPAAVRGLRAALGHSRAEFARALGVSAATVGNWENANRPLQLQAGSLAALRRLNRNRPG